MLNVLLGAGFAQGLGLPGTDDITNYVRSIRKYGIRGDGIAEVPAGVMLWKVANAYYDTPSFETLLHLVESMLSARRSRFGFTVDDSQKIAFNAFMDPTPRLAAVLSDSALFSFGSDMMAEVADYLDQSIARSKMEKQGHIRDFFSPYLSEDTLRISTLNYDDSIERSFSGREALWDGFTADNPGSIDYGGFANVHDVELLHLHGSIRFGWPKPDGRPQAFPSLERYTSNHDAKPFRYIPPTFNAVTQAGELIFTGPMLSGLRKAEKLIVEPYGLYHHRFASGLLESPKLLCVGYGGNDTYVNSAMLRARQVHGTHFKAVYVTKLPAAREDVPLRDYAALAIPASHSIQYNHEFDGFVQRVQQSDLAIEENGMLLIGTGFPLEEATRERILTFFYGRGPTQKGSRRARS